MLTHVDPVGVHRHGQLHVVVDDEVIIIRSQGHFVPGPAQTLLYFLSGVGAPAHQAVLQLRPGRRSQENTHGVRPLGVDLLRTLHVDLQHYIPALSQGLIHGDPGCAVKIPGITRMLQQLVPLHHLQKRVVTDEVIVYAVHLAGAGRPGSSGNRQEHVRVVLHSAFEHRTLSGPGRAGKNKNFALLFQSQISSCMKSSADSPRRGPSFSAGRAESTTWSLSITSTAAVLRP